MNSRELLRVGKKIEQGSSLVGVDEGGSEESIVASSKSGGTGKERVE